MRGKTKNGTPGIEEDSLQPYGPNRRSMSDLVTKEHHRRMGVSHQNRERQEQIPGYGDSRKANAAHDDYRQQREKQEASQWPACKYGWRKICPDPGSNYTVSIHRRLTSGGLSFRRGLCRPRR